MIAVRLGYAVLQHCVATNMSGVPLGAACQSRVCQSRVHVKPFFTTINSTQFPGRSCTLWSYAGRQMSSGKFRKPAAVASLDRTQKTRFAFTGDQPTCCCSFMQSVCISLSSRCNNPCHYNTVHEGLSCFVHRPQDVFCNSARKGIPRRCWYQRASAED